VTTPPVRTTVVRRTRRGLGAGVLLAGLLALPSAVVHAAGPASVAVDDATVAANKTAAREKAARGLELFEAKRWAEAYEVFKQGDDLYHVPTLTLAMAQCQRELGRLLAARALYQRLVDEPLAADAPEQFRGARATAQSELAALIQRIPTLVIVVSGPLAERARVEVDGVVIDGPERAAGRLLDPGEHTISASGIGVNSTRLVVTLSEGTTRRVELVPGSAGNAAGTGKGPLWLALSLLAPGGAGIAIGVATGVVAMGKSDGIRSRCRSVLGEVHCLAADVPERDAAGALGTVSQVALAIGSAALIGGTVLAVIRPGKPDMQVAVGAGSISVSGRF
jgi:hypothetical protein